MDPMDDDQFEKVEDTNDNVNVQRESLDNQQLIARAAEIPTR